VKYLVENGGNVEAKDNKKNQNQIAGHLSILLQGMEGNISLSFYYNKELMLIRRMKVHNIFIQ